MFTSSSQVAQLYQKTLREQDQQLQKLQKLDMNLSRARLALAILMGYFIYGFYQPQVLVWINSVALLISTVAFVFVWRYHNGKIHQLARCEGRIAQVQQGLCRVERDWSQLEPVPENLSQSSSTLDRDLNLFGHGSLGQLLFNKSTINGDKVLAKWLQQPGSTEHIKQRQQAVFQLKQNIFYCQQLSVVARQARLQYGFISRFANWAAQSMDGTKPVKRKQWIVLTYIANTLMLGCLLFSFFYSQFFSGALALVLLNGVITWFSRSRHHQAFGDLEGAHQGVETLKELAAETLVQDFSDPYLLLQQQTLKGSSKANAVAQLQKLETLLFHSQLRFNVIPYLVMQLLFLWDNHIYYRLSVWKGEHGDDIAETVEAVSVLEALSSLAIVAYENPEWRMPVVHETHYPDVVLKDAGNPLIANHQCVTNDIELTSEKRLIIVTGSNMSGKTTYMRTLGLNIKLALLGCTVFAKSMQTPNLLLVSSMHVNDALHEGKSFFMNELLQLKQVMESARQTEEGRVLYLLDEVLKGTNNQDKYTATVAVLKTLLEHNTLGMLTTHDIEIAQAPELSLYSRSVYFQESLDSENGDEMSSLSFDFKAKPGVVSGSNGLKMAKLLGVIY